MTAASRRPVLVVAHRGASARAPENTLPALDWAVRLGADGVEVDVQRTADGVLVLVHDDDWQRTTGYAGSVAATPWECVRRLDAGSWFGVEHAGTAPPRLEKVLQAMPPHLLLNLELKSPGLHPGLGSAVVQALRGHPHRVLLTSFDWDCIEALLPTAGGIELGLLSVAPLQRESAVRTRSLAWAGILGQPEIVPAVHARGFPYPLRQGQLSELLRPRERDEFR